MHNVSSSILATDDRNAVCVARTIVTLYGMKQKLRQKKASPEEMETERMAKPYPFLKYLETYMQDVHRQIHTPERLWRRHGVIPSSHGYALANMCIV